MLRLCRWRREQKSNRLRSGPPNDRTWNSKMKTNVDPRLLLFLPHYKKLWQQDNPSLKGRLADQMAADALLKALEQVGHARRVLQPDGSLRWRPTDEYLKQIEPKH